MNELYPLKFKPIFKDKIWGGRKAKTVFGLDFDPLPNCGEVWVLSGYPGNESEVCNGFLEGNSLSELTEVYMADLLGDKVFDCFGTEFPLLIKILDSNDWLSIQVHPDDELAAKRHSGSGKTEMWYVIDAEPGAELISGFKSRITPEKYLERIKNKSLASVLNYEKAKAGDVFFIPAGRVHAIGPGLFIAEIQQSSDTTYRIYDFDRLDDAGKPRDLHTELALDAIDFELHEDIRTQYTSSLNKTGTLVDSPYFHTGMLHFNKQVVADYNQLDSCVILLCIQGLCSVVYPGGSESLKAGEVMLIPAEITEIRLVPEKETRLLEIYLP